MVRIDVNADTDYDAIPEPSISGPCSPIHTSGRFPPVGLFRSSYDGLYAERTEVEGLRVGDLAVAESRSFSGPLRGSSGASIVPKRVWRFSLALPI